LILDLSSKAQESAVLSIQKVTSCSGYWLNDSCQWTRNLFRRGFFFTSFPLVRHFLRSIPYSCAASGIFLLLNLILFCLFFLLLKLNEVYILWLLEPQLLMPIRNYLSGTIERWLWIIMAIIFLVLESKVLMSVLCIIVAMWPKHSIFNSMRYVNPSHKKLCALYVAHCLPPYWLLLSSQRDTRIREDTIQWWFPFCLFPILNPSKKMSEKIKSKSSFLQTFSSLNLKEGFIPANPIPKRGFLV